MTSLLKFVLFHILLEESLHLFKRYDIFSVIQVCVNGARDKHEFFIVSLQKFERILSQIAGVSLISMDHQNSAVDLTCVGKQTRIHKRCLRVDSPAVIRVE